VDGFMSACVVLSVLGGLMVLRHGRWPRVDLLRWRAKRRAAKDRAECSSSSASCIPRFGSPANAVLLQTGMALAVLGAGAR